MNKQKLKEPRHVCRICGSKLYESNMILFGTTKNGMPVWVCNNLPDIFLSCESNALIAVANGSLKVSVNVDNQQVTKNC